MLESEYKAALSGLFPDRVVYDEPIAKYTSARLGGPADAFLAVDQTADLASVARFAWDRDLPLLVLGAGSNILISDRGVRGIVVQNRCKRLTITGDTVHAESGIGMIQLARRISAKGLSGLEWATGIPGTLGGSLYGNAGAHGGDTSNSVGTIDLITPAGRLEATSPDMRYEYRSSCYKREGLPLALLSASFTLTPDDPTLIAERIKAYQARRKVTQPGGATMGSTFKNPEGDYAGRLLEAAGLKGTWVGGAMISELHANFFLNEDNATAQDVMDLIDLAREKVFSLFGIELELEIEPVGDWGKV